MTRARLSRFMCYLVGHQQEPVFRDMRQEPIAISGVECLRCGRWWGIEEIEADAKRMPDPKLAMIGYALEALFGIIGGLVLALLAKEILL